MRITKYLDFISKNKKKIYYAITCLVLLNAAFYTLKSLRYSKIKEDTSNIDYLHESVNIKPTTKQDLLLPDPTDESKKEFEQYNILTFSEISLKNNTLSVTLTNNSDDTIYSPYLAIFSDNPNDIIYIHSQEEIKANQSIVLTKEDINLEEFNIYKYNYFLKIDENLSPISVDLKNSSAYVGQPPEDSNIY